MPCRADYHRFLMRRTELRDGWRRVVGAEINDHIPLPYRRPQVVALVNLADDLQAVMVGRTRNERSAHATLGTDNDNFGHKWCVKRET